MEFKLIGTSIITALIFLWIVSASNASEDVLGSEQWSAGFNRAYISIHGLSHAVI